MFDVAFPQDQPIVTSQTLFFLFAEKDKPKALSLKTMPRYDALGLN